MKWGFFPVGSATLEVLPAKMEGNESCYILSFAVRTNAFADKIYKVRTEIESVVNSDFTHALKYRKKQREGRQSEMWKFILTTKIRRPFIVKKERIR